jgi:Porin PorA
MRRVVTVLAGAGAFLVVLALLTKFYVAGQVLKFPLNGRTVLTLADPNGRYFSASQLMVLDVPVTVTDTIQGDVAASSGSIAVFDEFQVVHDDFNNVNFSYLQRRAPFDRRTGVLVNCCGAYLNGDHSVHLSGQGFFWPLGAQRHTYQLFDTTLGRAVPATYAGTSVTDGLTTYRYVENVPAQKASTLTLPGSLVGMKNQPEVTLPEYYQSVNTYWVDPVTGLPLNVERNETLTLRDSAGAVRLLAFQADLKMKPSSIAAQASMARSNERKISLVSTILPLALLVLGVVAMGVAIVLSARHPGSRGKPRNPEDRTEPLSQVDESRS